MFEKMPISLVFTGIVVVASLFSVIATAVAGVVVGIPVFLVFTVVAYFAIENRIAKPVRNLASTVHRLENSLDADVNDMQAMSTAFDNELDSVSNVSAELSSLSDGLRRARDTFQRRLTELDSLHAISQTITSSTLDYEKTVKSVLAAVQRVVDYDAAEVGVLHGNSLTVEAWWGKDGFKDTTGRRYRLGKGPTGTIAATKEPLFLATVNASEDLQRTIGYASVETEFIAKSTKLIINSFLGIPLLIGDKLIGTLTLVHHEPGFFTEDDMRQLNKLADHASIAIDNALQVREREEELKKQIKDLQIEIDQAKLTTQVEEVTGTDFFKNLQDSAARMRERQNNNRERNRDEDKEKEDETQTEANSATDSTE